jgi:hypothetical protein
VEYRGRGFWAYDESLAILLYIAADAAEKPPFDNDFPSDFVKQWRVLTLVGGNFAFQLDDLCADDYRRERFVELMSRCGDELRQSPELTGAVVESWRALGEKVIWRGGQGDDVVSTTPIVELASAIVELVRGELPKPPPGHWWFIGTSGGIDSIAMEPGGHVTG